MNSCISGRVGLAGLESTRAELSLARSLPLAAPLSETALFWRESFNYYRVPSAACLSGAVLGSSLRIMTSLLTPHAGPTSLCWAVVPHAGPEILRGNLN